MKPRTMTTPIRFLVSDVDGTLVDANKDVTPAAQAAVQSLHDAEVGFAFVSSRPPRGLAYVADALELAKHVREGPAAAAFNGGALLDAQLQPIAFTPLLDADARIALDVFAAMKIDIWVFTLTEWLLVDPDGHYVAHERHTVGFDHRCVASFDGLGPDLMRGIGKIVGSSTDPDLLERAAKTLAERLSPHAKASLSQAYYLDVTHAEANKGAALRAIAAHAGLTLHEMAAIGDMRNDLAMLDIAGLSIAMGNAPDDVKAAADEVTDSNRDEGFAKAVQRFVLPRATKEIA